MTDLEAEARKAIPTERMVLDRVRIIADVEGLSHTLKSHSLLGREAFILEQMGAHNCHEHGPSFFYRVAYRPDDDQRQQARTVILCHHDLTDEWE